jgi:deoxyribodipyrimidine photo-lyase
MTQDKLIIYIVHHDLRLSDNPIFHELSRAHQTKTCPFTHVLPLYIFRPHQIETSGFIPKGADDAVITEPRYPEARTELGGFWRCGPHRAKFRAESVWDLKESLESIGSGLVMRIGKADEVVRDIIEKLEVRKDIAGDVGNLSISDCRSELVELELSGNKIKVVGVWMMAEEGIEDKEEQEQLRSLVEDQGKEFRLFLNEGYFVDEYGTLLAKRYLE